MTHFFSRATASLKNLTSRLHGDQRGIEAIQVVMILGIAAFVLIAFWAVGDDVLDWMKSKVEEFMR